MVADSDKRFGLNERPEGYHRALGRFIDKFSLVEHMLFWLLMKTAAVPLRTAQAIFSDARIDKAKDQINRIRAAHGLPKDEALTRAFLQMGQIARMRNDVVHYGIQQANKDWVVTNALVAHTRDTQRTSPLSVEILEDMTLDLNTIFVAITRLWIIDRLDETTADALEKAVLVPWRYRPHGPSHPAKNTLRKTKARLRPPQSSGA
jgi:hypothetical protein